MAQAPEESTKTASRQPPSLTLAMAADAPVDDDAADRLRMGDIADGLALLIDGEDTSTPLTIAVSAPWGAGKTSLLRLVRNRLVRRRLGRGEAPHIVVWFNAWMHDAAPDLGAALAAAVAREANRHRDPWRRVWRPIPSSMLSPKERAGRRRWLVLASLLPALAFVPILSGFVEPSPDDVGAVRTQFGGAAAAWFAALWLVHAAWSRVKGGVAAVAAFVDDPSAAASTGSMHEVSAQLGELISEARSGSASAWRAPDRPPLFVVVIDDLERCQPPKAVDVCEVASQLLHHDGVVTVLVGDLRVIAASAELKYGDAAKRFSADPSAALDGWGDYGRFYLQKVVQFELELPPIRRARLEMLARTVPPTAAIWGESAPPTPPRRTRQVLLAAGGIVGAAMGIGGLWADGRALVVGTSIVTAIVSAAFGARVEARRRQELRAAERRRVLVARVGQLVRDEASRGYTGNLEDAVLRRYAAIEELADDETAIVVTTVRESLATLMAEEDDARWQAEEAVLALLPPLPRTAKRLVNRLRFLLVVADARRLLDVVEPAQVGKWAVLLDRWPSVTSAVVADPDVVTRLEEAATSDDPAHFAAVVAGLRGLTPELSEWLRTTFFATGPSIGDVASDLAYLDLDEQ